MSVSRSKAAYQYAGILPEAIVYNCTHKDRGYIQTCGLVVGELAGRSLKVIFQVMQSGNRYVGDDLWRDVVGESTVQKLSVEGFFLISEALLLRLRETGGCA